MKMFQSVDPVSQPATKEISGPSIIQTTDTNIRQILAIGEVSSYVHYMYPRPQYLQWPLKANMGGFWPVATSKLLYCPHSYLKR